MDIESFAKLFTETTIQVDNQNIEIRYINAEQNDARDWNVYIEYRRAEADKKTVLHQTTLLLDHYGDNGMPSNDYDHMTAEQEEIFMDALLKHLYGSLRKKNIAAKKAAVMMKLGKLSEKYND